MADGRGVITAIGRKKLCMAHSGDKELPAITKMAWGNGGVDDSGQPFATTGEETGLSHELMVKDVDGHTYVGDGNTTCRYTATLDAEDLAGEMISEMGLIDSEGDLVAYRTFLAKGKDSDIPQIYDMDEIF